MPKTLLTQQTVSSLEETQSLIHQWFEEYFLSVAGTIFLQGKLGAGKTTIATEILRLYGITESVNSPTYNYVYIYEAEAFEIAHFDCYRLEEGDFHAKGLHDIAGDESVMSLVEWGEKLTEPELACFIKPAFVIDIEIKGEDRVLSLFKKG